jgi:hypothetical protein
MTLADRGGVHLRRGAVFRYEGAILTADFRSDNRSGFLAQPSDRFAVDLRVLRDLAIAPMRPLHIGQQLCDCTAFVLVGARDAVRAFTARNLRYVVPKFASLPSEKAEPAYFDPAGPSPAPFPTDGAGPNFGVMVGDAEKFNRLRICATDVDTSMTA